MTGDDPPEVMRLLEQCDRVMQVLNLANTEQLSRERALSLVTDELKVLRRLIRDASATEPKTLSPAVRLAIGTAARTVAVKIIEMILGAHNYYDACLEWCARNRCSTKAA